MPMDDSKPATRGDIARLEQKLDQNVSRLDQNIVRLDQHVVRLDQKIDRVASSVVKLQSEVSEIKQTMSTKDDVNRILNAIDSFAGKAQNYDRASVLHGHALVEIEVKVQDHEKRLKKLEIE